MAKDRDPTHGLAKRLASDAPRLKPGKGGRLTRRPVGNAQDKISAQLKLLTEERPNVKAALESLVETLKGFQRSNFEFAELKRRLKEKRKQKEIERENKEIEDTTGLPLQVALLLGLGPKNRLL